MGVKKNKMILNQKVEFNPWSSGVERNKAFYVLYMCHLDSKVKAFTNMKIWGGGE